MSVSIENYSYKDKKKDDDCCIFPKHSEPKKILLECGCNPQDALFDPAQEEPVTKTLDKVTVDTTCLCRPQVKIEFSSLVFFDVKQISPPQRSYELFLTFELVKRCNGSTEVLREWEYKKIVRFKSGDGKIIEDWKEKEPFTVTYCDRACADCCVYEMRVTSTKINDSSSDPDFDAVNVTLPDISALAQGICE